MSVRTVGHTALRAAFWTAGMALALPNRAIAAQITPPDYGFQWSTIGTPGNRGLLASEATFERNIGRGSVDHTYRLAQTEITNAQWLQFVQAYGPYYLQDHPTHDQITALTGDGIDYLFGPWVMSPSTNPNAPANMGWRYAAMYCNWLCNGKRTDRAAFETGAYNVSTFTQNTDGSLNDQLVHTPGAAFWIPTLDEWFKAAYFDPNMVGPDGQLGAYQKFVGGSDSPLPAGDPASGGLTNVNCDGPTSVASYPACGPWGLFDQSGGVSEWTETMAASITGFIRPSCRGSIVTRGVRFP